MKVSVIIPVYNEEEFLEQCLKAVCSQTLKDIEILCIDDGSTDNSMNILKKYSDIDNRIKIFKQNRRGGGAARNLGISKATGEYLSFLDADDFFEKEMLEKIYDKCIKTESDLGIFKVHFYHQSTGAITDEAYGLREEFLPEKEVFNYKDMPNYIFNTFHNWAWNKLFKREFILKNNIKFQEIKRTNDLLFTTKSLILAKRITTLKERLIYYRVRISGNCQSTNNDSPFDFYKAFRLLKEFLIDNNLYDLVRQSFINHALDGCISNLNTNEYNKTHELIFDRLKQEIFNELDINNCSKELIYEFNKTNEIYEQYCKINELEYKDYLLYRADKLRLKYQQAQFDLYKKDCKLRIITNTIPYKCFKIIKNKLTKNR